jgi:SAM-dependent methyltransferase
MGPAAAELPLPPFEMRQLVGPTDPAAFENPSGGPVFPEVDDHLYADVFDFGCGCGRVARQLLQQRTQPSRYVGVDLHRGMIAWCQLNLAPQAPVFTFVHHDVFNTVFNPGPEKPRISPFPVEDSSFSLVVAFSVFTHLTQDQVEFYLRECARILRPEGVLYSTWFLFDKNVFPMMHEFQNALYINLEDPSNAVIFDREWLRGTARELGFVISFVRRPEVRGHQWVVLMTQSKSSAEVAFPADDAPLGLARPPMPVKDPAAVGQEELDVLASGTKGATS